MRSFRQSHKLVILFVCLSVPNFFLAMCILICLQPSYSIILALWGRYHVFLRHLYGQSSQAVVKQSSWSCREAFSVLFCMRVYVKVAFCQKVPCVFQISKSLKRIFRKTLLSLKCKFPTNNSKLFLAENFNFKLRIVFWNFFWRFEKRITLSEKSHL